MRTVIALLVLVFLVAMGVVWWAQFEDFPPEAALLTEARTLGGNAALDFQLRADTPGLKAVTVQLRAGAEGAEKSVFALHSQTFPATSWRGSGVTEAQVHVEPDFLEQKVPEGAATLEVLVETYSWHFRPPPAGPRLAVPVTIDLTAPRIELLSRQHNVRLGGSELVVFRQSADTVHSGVAVKDYFFPATKGYFADADVALAFFAVPQDLDTEVRPRLVARDAAGNERETNLPCHIAPREFAQRTLRIEDSFLQRKVPEILQDNRLPPSQDLLQGYLYINGKLRAQNEARIREITATSAPDRLWDGTFHRQPNAASVSSFADRRTYEYDGKRVDRQVHLGYDLASVRLSAVVAAQNGEVVFADDLGIYGNTVILDHGLGVFSLYGHLSTITVQAGDRVRSGQTLGQTGESGLAGGDHLHFSVMLNGVHVDPLEWWDGRWLRAHVLSKLKLLPRAKAAASAKP